MKKFKYAVAVVGMAVMMCGAQAIAADAPALKIGVVDMNKVVQETDAAKGIFSQLEDKRKEYQKKIVGEEDALRKTEQDISKQREKLSKEEFEKKRVEFDKKVMAGQKMVQEHRQTLDGAFAQSMNTLKQEAAKIVGAVAKEKGITVVLAQDAVMMAVPEMDITDQVIERMNSSVKKIPVEWSAKKKKAE